MPLRPMKAQDLLQVNMVLSKAFTKAKFVEGYKEFYVPPCRLEFLEMYLVSYPAGSFIFEKKGRIEGFVFSHLWGSVGWIGPLAVLPERQGEGLGRWLVEGAVNALIAAGARTIGLETMPRNYRNIRFYSLLDFIPGYLSVDLVRPLSKTAFLNLEWPFSQEQFSRLSRPQKQEFLHKADQLARRIDPHLQVGSEIELTFSSGYGDAFLLLKERDPIGFAIAHTEKYYEDEPRNYLKVYLAALRPNYDEQDLQAFLTMLENWAYAGELDELMLRTSTRQRTAFQRLMKNGFRVIHSDLRFNLKGYDEVANFAYFYLNKWE